MNEIAYANLRSSTEAAFTALYEIDAKKMDTKERDQLQEVMGAAYLAMIRLENTEFANLTGIAVRQLAALKTGAEELQKQLEGLKTTTEIIKTISSSLNLLRSIATILK